MGMSCNNDDHDPFPMGTKVMTGDGNKCKFWESSWLVGLKPKHNAPIFWGISCKNGGIIYNKALGDGFWVL